MILHAMAALEVLALSAVVIYSVAFLAMSVWVLLRVTRDVPLGPENEGLPKIDELVEDFRKELDSVEMGSADWNELRTRRW